MAAQVTSVAVSTSFSTSTLLTPFTRTATSLIAIPTEYTTDSTRVGPLGDTIIQSDLVVPTVTTSTLETLISHIRTIRTSIPVNTIYSLSTVSTSTPSTTTTSTTMAAQPPGRPGPPGTSSTTSSNANVVIVTAYTTITPSSTSSRASSSSSSRLSSVRGASAGADQNNGSTFSKSNGGLSIGAIAGIAVGGLAAILIVALVAVLCIRRKRRDSRRDSSLYAHAPSNEKLAEDPSGGTFDVLPRNAPPATSGGGGYNYAALGSAGAVLTGAAAGAAAGTAARRQSQQKLTNQQRQSATRELARNARPTPPPVSQLQYARPASQQPNAVASGSGSGYSATPIAARWASQNNLAQEQEQRPMPSHIARVQAHDMGQQQAQPHQQPIASTSAGAAGGDAASQLSRSSTTKSIAPELLGKGAGYASPMPPMGPDGKILDQKTFRERQSLIAQGFNPAIDLTAEQKMRRDSQLAALQDQAQRRTSAAIANQKQGAAAAVNNSSAPGPSSPPTSPPPAVVSPTRRVSAQQVQSQPRQQPQTQYPSYQPQAAPQQLVNQSRLSDVIPGPPPSSNNPAGPSYQTSPPSQSLPPVPQQQRASYQIYQPQSAASQPPVRASLISPPGMRANGITGRDLPSPPIQSQYPSPPSSDFSPPRTQSYQVPPGAAASPYQQYSYSNDPARSRQHQTFADDVYGGLTSGLSDRDIARLSRGGPSAPPRR